MKVLIWQTAYLGDVVLATPLIKTLKINFPNAKIGFVGRPFISELLKGFDIELIPFSKGLFESLEIRKKIRDYDVAISPHRSMRTALILYFSGIKERIGFDKSEFSFLYTKRIKHEWGIHEVERNLRLLEPLGVRNFSKDTELRMEEDEFKGILEKFSLKEKEYVVLSPFSNFRLKEWSLRNWARLINELRVPAVITGTKSDIEKVRELNDLTERSFLNLVGKTSLRELMGVIKGAKLVIANDSSPVHIANAFGVPAITIYTATSELYGFYPLIGRYLRNPAPCSPCSPNPKRCMRGDELCRSLPAPEDVLSTAEELLGV
ncbi:glycosyltransferase family 9 protein [Aquifex pyrophilus]